MLSVRDRPNPSDSDRALGFVLGWGLLLLMALAFTGLMDRGCGGCGH